MRVTLDAHGAISGLENPRVFVDGVERTYLADVELVAQDAFDIDGDGGVDATRVSYEVALGDLALEIGDVVEVELGAATAQGPELVRVAAIVESHVDLRFSDTTYLGGEPAVLQLQWHELPLTASALVVKIAGFDVTQYVSISGPELVEEDVVGGQVVSRTENYTLNCGALAGFGLEGLPLSIEAWGGTSDGGLTSDSTTSTIVGEQELNDCQKKAFDDFCAAMKFSKDAATNAVCSGASEAEQKAAADALQAALRLCPPPHPAAQQRITCNGLTVDVRIGADGQDASASGSADAVVAIGGDGAADSNADGGNATATNTQPGGAAVAIGGDGGGGNTTSAGDGGNATAEAQNGANGTPPGCATAVGGTGGSPTPNHKAGGKGGDATAKTKPKGDKKEGKGPKGAKGKPPSGSNPGVPGKHGNGGSAHLTGAVGSGTPGTTANNP